MQIIDNELINKLYQQAEVSDRKRSHHQLHGSHQDKVQRLLIAFVKGSYVEPHFHELPHQWEMFNVIEGCVKVCVYSDIGEVIEELFFGLEENNKFVEFSPYEIHSVECISEKALMLEIKEGPFDSIFAKTFPQW
ncbi:WbuC family cupin fold metalloprotein [Yersinia ruckeri]|uniref:WbuC family cupin fold metalloprotein n=1 Tax=Yersinia ruckeri TaxID=29486 RepID=UPI000537DAEF|nr:WbuC family cupin fold metalloprotein [Yersinia ruckeri]AUQ40660.1 cupin fold metalloprotein, WbuC family [Yersinia ruckeri]WMS05452.1 WbuC family cupin fold metalloprotein [Yersinia ruckeri]